MKNKLMNIRPFLPLLVMMVLAMIILSGVNLLAADQIRIATDTLTSGGKIYIMGLLPVIIALAAVGFAMSYLSKSMQARFTAYSIESMKNKMADKISRISYAYFDERGSGSMLTKLTEDMGEAQAFLSDSLPTLCWMINIIVCYLVYMFIMSARLTLVSMIVFPLVMLAAHIASRKLTKLTKARLKGIDDFTGALTDAIGGTYTEKSYNLQNIINTKISGKIAAALAPDLARQRVMAVSSTLFYFSRWLPLFACCAYGAYVAYSGGMTVGGLVAFVLILPSLSGPISELPYIITEIKQQAVSIERLEELYALKEEQSGDVACAVENSDAVSFKNVNFSYDEIPVLKNLSFTVKKGSRAAITGPSGCGKTTIFKLLCGLYEIKSGEYILIGNNFTKWNIQKARENIALVSQDVFMFPTSIGKNIAMGKPGANQQDIEKAAKAAGIHDFIMSLPNGYDSQIGERGVRVSGGERQRISIAQAFLKDAPILLLDEPTSALDSASEALIGKSLAALTQGRTVITIAHRLSTIQSADEIIVMDAGEIAEVGTHEALLNRGGVYARLYQKQLFSETEETEGNEDER